MGALQFETCQDLGSKQVFCFHTHSNKATSTIPSCAKLFICCDCLKTAVFIEDKAAIERTGKSAWNSDFLKG